MSNGNEKETKDILKRSAIRALWIVAIVFAIFFLQGCGNKRLAPVEERDATGKQAQSSSFYPPTEVDNSQQFYKVTAGDTLYSIAFRYGVDFKTLARVNNIDSNYTIHPGLLLDLHKARVSETGQEQTEHQLAKTETSAVAIDNRRTSGVKSVAREVKSNKTEPKTNRNTATTTQPKVVVAKPKTTKPKTTSLKTTSSQTTKPETKKTTTTKETTTKKAETNKTVTKKQNNSTSSQSLGNKAVKYWMWPAMGDIISRFSNSSKSSRGIDIAGNMGDPVRAAAAGRVVYAGRGLRGYGNLLIIKHNNDFISAYAHNKKLLVKENEIIKAGQKIAEIGNTDSEIPKLHFEIRYRGKPTDPMKYLPKR